MAWLVALLVASGAWVFSNPVMAAPDEPANLIKAVASGRGQWLGEQLEPGFSGYAAEPPRRRAWYQDVSRRFLLPARAVAPPRSTCFAFTKAPAACTATVAYPADSRSQSAVTPQGAYPPFLYAPLGLPTFLGNSFREVTWLARMAGAAMTMVLLAAAAVAAVGDRTRRPEAALRLAGLALAVTPMVVFLGATVSTNGVEAAAGITTWLVALRLRRNVRWWHRRLVARPGTARAGQWWLLAALATVLSLSRILGPLFLLVIAAVVLLLGPESRTPPGEPDDAVEVVPARRLVGPGMLAGAAVVLTLVWDLAIMPKLAVDHQLARSAVRPLLGDIGEELRQAVGVFGWLDSRLPTPIYVAWQLAVTAGFVVALILGNLRERLAVLALPVAALACYLTIGALLEEQIDFGMQARYVLVPLTGVPLVALEVVARRLSAQAKTAGTAVAAVALTLALLGQALAIVTNLHRYAVGSGISLTSWSTRWEAPGGNELWLIAAAVVAALALLAGAMLLTSNRLASRRAAATGPDTG